MTSSAKISQHLSWNGLSEPSRCQSISVHNYLRLGRLFHRRNTLHCDPSSQDPRICMTSRIGQNYKQSNTWIPRVMNALVT